MVLTHLHRFHFPTFFPKSQSLYTSLSLLPPPSLSKLLTRPRYSTLLAAELPPSTEPAAAEPLDPSIEIPLNKLFVPPDTDVSCDSSALTAKVLKGSNIVLSRYARDAQVAEAEFVKSSVQTDACPSDGLPEFALVYIKKKPLPGASSCVLSISIASACVQAATASFIVG